MQYQGEKGLLWFLSYVHCNGNFESYRRQFCTLLLSANQYRRSSSCSAARHASLSLNNARFSKKHLGESRSGDGGGQELREIPPRLPSDLPLYRRQFFSVFCSSTNHQSIDRLSLLHTSLFGGPCSVVRVSLISRHPILV